MIKIQIDKIIEKLKKIKKTEWGNYENELKLHLSDFNEKVFLLEDFIGLNGIILDDELIIKQSTLKDKNNNFWKWSYRNKNLGSFFELEQEFKNIFCGEIKFCPYCGKIPLIRYENDKNEKKGTFDLDHIFPKGKYKFLTYNFYNLVPICKICNQMKGQKSIKSYLKSEIFHSYYGLFKKNGSKIIIDETGFMDDDILNTLNNDNISFYELEKIYNNSQDTSNDFLFIDDKNKKIMLDKLKNISTFDINERKDYYFKNFYPENEEDILKYSNGKYKRNIIKNLKI